jgi:hypothetical protein
LKNLGDILSICDCIDILNDVNPQVDIEEKFEESEKFIKIKCKKCGNAVKTVSGIEWLNEKVLVKTEKEAEEKKINYLSDL